MSTWLRRIFGHKNTEEPLIADEVFEAVAGDRIAPGDIVQLEDPKLDDRDERNRTVGIDWGRGDQATTVIIDEVAQVDPESVDVERPIGIALEDSDTEGHGMSISMAFTSDFFRQAYHGSMCANLAYGPRDFYARHIQEIAPFELRRRHPYGDGRYKESKFPDKVQEKAWKLLEDYMKPSQYNAFINGRAIELINKTESHRLMINNQGNFTLLEGTIGEGFIVLQGAIREMDYPLGDEIAAFIDWFSFKTGELIERWRCGNFSIVSENKKG